MISILTGLIPIFGKVLEKAVPDKDLREKLSHELATMGEEHAQAQIMAQIELNKTEAAHKSLFVAGWRPFTGWACGAALAFNYLILPILNWAITMWGTPIQIVENGMARTELPLLPVLDLEVMLPVLLGMLGLGGMRSYEKRNGVSRER